MVPCRLLLVLSVSAVLTLRTVAQSEPDAIERTLPAWFSAEACDAIPHSEVQVCVPAPFEGVPLSPVVSPPALASITLKVAEGTPLRIAIDDRTRIQDVGEPIHGKLMEGVYSFDQEVIPAGSVATGKVTRIAAVSGFRRTLAYANGNLTPFHEYEVTFDSVTLPSGKQIAIHTSARAGTAEVVHLVSNPDKQEKGAAGRATDRARAEAKGKIAEAKEEAHDAWEKLTAPPKHAQPKD